MKKDKEMPEELEAEMHAEFQVDDETAMQHRVWAAISMQRDTGWPLSRVLASLDLTQEEFDFYKSTIPEG